MTTYPVRLPSALLIKITAGLVLFFGILCGAHAGGGNTSLVVKSGEAKEICKCGGHWRVDSSGKVWPVSIEVVHSAEERCRDDASEHRATQIEKRRGQDRAADQRGVPIQEGLCR